MPQVSVIIPNYNHAPYLQQRIDSVLNQTYQDFEVIILDDCSTDDSRTIIQKYSGHPKISQIIFNEVNSGGPFNQWKKGVEQAKGKYIWIAESDDWCELTLLETLVQALEDNPRCVMAYAQTYTINGDNVIEQQSTHDKLAEYVDGKKYISQYLAPNCSIWNSSMLVFKKESYLNTSEKFLTFKMCGDWLLYIEMAKQGDVFISGKNLNYFRSHEKDVSSKIYGSGYNYIEELKILKILKNEGLISQQEYKAHLLYKYIWVTTFRHSFEQSINKEISESLYNNGSESYKWFLLTVGNFSLVKSKIRRRLSLIFK